MQSWKKGGEENIDAYTRKMKAINQLRKEIPGIPIFLCASNDFSQSETPAL